MTEPRTPPLSTYRLQLGPDLDFAAAAGLVDYLADLGVSHLYLSPVLVARAGSTHGYDVADPRTVSPALGGEEGLRDLASAARRRGLGLVVDIVPNHVGTGGGTPLWDRLLAEGPADRVAGFFDVDWDPALPGAAGKVILPILGDQYGHVLAAGELVLEERRADLRLRYHEHDLPISRETAEGVTRSGGAAALAGRPGDPGSWHRLHALLEAQHYRLVHWRHGEALVNYRRFFSINDLAAVRVEDEAVFDHTHAAILDLVADRVVDGLRVDHPDGLTDPRRYFERLASRTGGVWVVAEKILHSDEALPDWPVAGTTGYEFANDVCGLFVDPDAEATLDELHTGFGGDPRPYDEQTAGAKAELLEGELAADLRRLTRAFWALAQEHPEVRDVDDRACGAALAALLVRMDVYRTYVDPETATAAPGDVALIEAAARRGAGDPAAPPFLTDFLVDVLTGRAGDGPGHRELITRFQQLSGALTAKGVEDTVFYRHRRLLAANEVGGDPSHLGLGAAGFHERNRARAARHPAGMLTTATHDTKRGEDSRLRIAALSELAGEWADACARLRRHCAPFVSQTGAGPAPDPPTEYLLYQTMVGVWPLAGRPDGAELGPRIRDYAVKACREAKQRTSWREPDEAFEAGVTAFVDAVLTSDESVTELSGIADRCAEVAMVAGLAQTLLRVASPGVPDTYRGAELWDDSLVDPDNRRPIDYPQRARLLAALDGEDPGRLLEARRDGRVKLWVLAGALRARRDHPDLFGADAGYEPLAVEGSWADHVVAFARTASDGSGAAVVVVPRLPGGVMRAAGAGDLHPPLGAAWGQTAVSLPAAGEWTDRLTGARHEGARLGVGALLAALPVSLLLPSRGTPEGRPRP